MKIMSLDDLRSLVGKSDPCVSLYVALSGSVSEDLEKINQRLSGAALQAKVVFPDVDLGIDRSNANEMMSHFAHGGIQNSTHRHPWGGIAIFYSEHQVGFYPIAGQIEDLIVLAESFHLKPVFPLMQVANRFALLKIEENRASLYAGSPDGFRMLRTFDRRIVDGSARFERATGLTSRIHRLSALGNQKRFTLKFFKDVEQGVRQLINMDDVPAVLVGSAKVIESFNFATKFRTQFVRTVDIGQGGLSEDLCYLSQFCLNELASHDRRRAIKGVFEYKHHRRFGRAVDTITSVARAANEGLVKSLLIRKGVNIWGRLSGAGKTQFSFSQASIGQANDDILDDIGEMVIRNGGEVHLLNAREMPTSSPIAAVLSDSFRYN